MLLGQRDLLGKGGVVGRQLVELGLKRIRAAGGFLDPGFHGREGGLRLCPGLVAAGLGGGGDGGEFLFKAGGAFALGLHLGLELGEHRFLLVVAGLEFAQSRLLLLEGGKLGVQPFDLGLELPLLLVGAVGRIREVAQPVLLGESFLQSRGKHFHFLRARLEVVLQGFDLGVDFGRGRFHFRLRGGGLGRFCGGLRLREAGNLDLEKIREILPDGRDRFAAFRFRDAQLRLDTGDQRLELERRLKDIAHTQTHGRDDLREVEFATDEEKPGVGLKFANGFDSGDRVGLGGPQVDDDQLAFGTLEGVRNGRMHLVGPPVNLAVFGDKGTSANFASETAEHDGL